MRVEAQTSGDFVYLLVQNPKPEPGHGGHDGNRMALDNIQARIQALFGDRAVLKHSHQGDIYTVTLRLPTQQVDRQGAQRHTSLIEAQRQTL